MKSREFTTYTLARAGEHSLIDIGGESGLPAYAGEYLRRVTNGGDVVMIAPNDVAPAVLAHGLRELARHLDQGHVGPRSVPAPSSALPSLHTRS